jgi:hypothetical protein
MPPYCRNVFKDKLVGELTSTTNVHIETRLEVRFNMSTWDWNVLEDDHPMPQMCILQNAQLQNNPTTSTHLTTCPKLWHKLVNHQQVSTFLTNIMTPYKNH